MNGKLSIALLAGVVALVVGFGVSYLRPVPEKIREIVKESLGAIPGTEITGDALKVGGVTNVYVSVAMRTASSTACVLRAPTASSTLESFALMFSGLGSRTGGFTVWKTSGLIATASPNLLFSKQVLSVQESGFGFTASGTGPTAFQNMHFASSTYLVVGVDTNFDGGGRCFAQWRSPFL